MYRKTHLIRITQYRVDGAPVMFWIGFPTHYAIQLVDKSGQVLDEINFGAKRRGAPHMDFAGKPWHNNRLTYLRKVVDREAINSPGERAFSEALALGMFEAIDTFAQDIDRADVDYFFMGNHPLKNRVGNSNSAAAGVARILGLDVDTFNNGKDQAPVGASKDIFAALGVDISTPHHYRRLAWREARRILKAQRAEGPIETILKDTPFSGWHFRLYRLRSAMRRGLNKIYDSVLGTRP